MQPVGERSFSLLTSVQLFQICASLPSDEACWAEFVKRFNPLLVRSITFTWRRYTQGEWPPAETAADLLQDVYATILKEDCRLLRNFRGASEAEAEAYLAHTVIHQIISHLRAQGAQKRQAELISWEELIASEKGEDRVRGLRAEPARGLSEQELIGLLQQVATGANRRRDMVLFLLHVRDGWSAAEIARMKLCELQSTSIANLLAQMKARLKKIGLGEV